MNVLRLVTALVCLASIAWTTESTAAAQSRGGIEEVHVTLDDLARLDEREVLELALHDGVVYTLEAGLPLDRVTVLVDRDSVPLETLIGRSEVREALVLGLDGPTAALIRAWPSLAQGGCWWVWTAEGWVRYCIA